MSKAYVLAPNREAFMGYLADNRLNPAHFHFISGVNDTRGIRGVVISVGRWWRNHGYQNADFLNAFDSMIKTGAVSHVQIPNPSQHRDYESELLGRFVDFKV